MNARLDTLEKRAREAVTAKAVPKRSAVSDDYQGPTG
jgi:hypothetical protein